MRGVERRINIDQPRAHSTFSNCYLHCHAWWLTNESRCSLHMNPSDSGTKRRKLVGASSKTYRSLKLPCRLWGNDVWLLSWSSRADTTALAGVRIPSESELMEWCSTFLCAVWTEFPFAAENWVLSSARPSTAPSTDVSTSPPVSSSCAVRLSLDVLLCMAPFRGNRARFVSRWLPSNDIFDRNVSAAKRLREWFFFRAAAIPHYTLIELFVCVCFSSF